MRKIVSFILSLSVAITASNANAALGEVSNAAAITKGESKERSPINIGSRRELFVDDYLIDNLDGLTLKLHEPHPAGTAIAFNEPWEQVWRLNRFTTVLRADDTCRM